MYNSTIDNDKIVFQSAEYSSLEPTIIGTNTTKTCIICFNQFNTNNKGDSISIISGTSDINDTSENILVEKFDIIRGTVKNYNYMKIYCINCAYEWFVNKNGKVPETNRELTEIERERIIFRRENSHYFLRQLNEKDAKKYVNDLFNKLLDKNNDINIIKNSDEYKFIRCHATPKMFPNYHEINREESEILLKNVGKDAIKLLIRPSKFKGYDFVREYDDEYYHMTEYTVISFCNKKTNEINHTLIEKYYGKCYYNVDGYYDNLNILHFNRGEKFDTFFDVFVSNISKLIDHDLL